MSDLTLLLYSSICSALTYDSPDPPPRQPASPWTWRDGQPEVETPPAPDMPPWVCVVCHRENQGISEACAVCFTKKGYRPDRLRWVPFLVVTGARLELRLQPGH